MTIILKYSGDSGYRHNIRVEIWKKRFLGFYLILFQIIPLFLRRKIHSIKNFVLLEILSFRS